MKCGDLYQFERQCQGEIPAVILILSTDRFDRERACQMVVSRLEGGYRRLDGEGLTAQQLRPELEGGSLFDEKVLLLVQSVERARKEAIDLLQEAANRPLPGLTLLLAGEKLLPQTALYKKVATSGLLLDLPTEKPWSVERERPEWVRGEARCMGKELALDGARLLVDRIGIDKESLYREVEKLVTYVGERKEIVRADVDQLTVHSTPPAMWELSRALFASDTGGALSIARRLIGGATPLPPLLTHLRKRIEEGIQICSLVERGGSVGAHFPHLTGRRLEGAIEEAKRFGMVRLCGALHALHETELLSRSQGANDLLLLQRWIAKSII